MSTSDPAASRKRHPVWAGSPRQYQARAISLYVDHIGHSLMPWTWITTTCGNDLCLNPKCMQVHQPRVIKYPRAICVYCGMPAGGVDHLLPEPWTGETYRHMVAVVPSCADCNARINDDPRPSVSDRRRKAQLSIERSAKLVLLGSDKTESELAELGYAMRTVAWKNAAKREAVRSRLAWPDDPFYDLRAFQKSGIEDPVILGLCDEFSTPLREDYAS